MSLSSTVLLGLAAVTVMLMLLGKRPRAPGKPDLRQRIRDAKNLGELDRVHREVLRLRSTDHKADTSPLFDAIRLKRSQLKTTNNHVNSRQVTRDNRHGVPRERTHPSR